MTIIVRFPPSPTGKMHLGSARTALYNWLYARHCGGKFTFRIEDTDKERSTPENTAFIYEALEWLELNWDNQPFLQTSRATEHVAAAKSLVEKGFAFVDAEGVTRFKVPEGATTWTDLVQGEITIENKQVDAFALLRSDGTPTYHIGVVADDAHMGITHVIRGVDHINNTPKHIMLFKALGHTVPAFAHIPLIVEADGKKLSKRHNAGSIQNLRDAGYLPHAVINYLLRLGWGHKDQEIFSREEAIQLFDITNVSKSPAQFDQTKLTWLNEHYLKSLKPAEILPYLRPFLPEGTDESILLKAWPELVKRAKTLKELADSAAPLLTDVTQLWTHEHAHALVEGHMPLHQHYDALSRLSNWEVTEIDAAIHAVVDKNAGDFKKAGKPLRVALTAQTGGPSLALLAYALGQKETLNRLKASLHAAHSHGASH